MAVPLALRDKYDAVAPLISAFCDDHLNNEYKALCLRLLEKLCRKRPSPLLSGREETWAAGIVYAIAANNFIFSKDNPFRLSARELAAPFGLSANAASTMASKIRRLLRLSSEDNTWLLPQYQTSVDLSDLPPIYRQGFERFKR